MVVVNENSALFQPHSGDPGLLHPVIACHAAYLSDFHLGIFSCNAREILDFLNHIQPQTLYLTGDIIDVWKTGKAEIENINAHKSIQHAILAKLKAFSTQGAKIVYIAGNHDNIFREPENEPLLQSLFKADIVPLETRHETEDGRRILLRHGDVFNGAPAKTNALNRKLAQLFEYVSHIGVSNTPSQGLTALAKMFKTVSLPTTWTFAQAFQELYRAVLHRSFEDAAFALLFKRNAEIDAWNKAHPSHPPKPYYDEIRCGHSHIPARKKRSSPRDEAGNLIGPANVVFSNAGGWTGLPRNGDDESTRYRITQPWIPFNTAILEFDDGREKYVRWVPTVGVVPLVLGKDGFPRNPSIFQARRRMKIFYKKIQNKSRALCKL